MRGEAGSRNRLNNGGVIDEPNSAINKLTTELGLSYRIGYWPCPPHSLYRYKSLILFVNTTACACTPHMYPTHRQFLCLPVSPNNAHYFRQRSIFTPRLDRREQHQRQTHVRHLAGRQVARRHAATYRDASPACLHPLLQPPFKLFNIPSTSPDQLFRHLSHTTLPQTSP
jgi:hypothetical protein